MNDDELNSIRADAKRFIEDRASFGKKDIFDVLGGMILQLTDEVIRLKATVPTEYVKPISIEGAIKRPTG